MTTRVLLLTGTITPAAGMLNNQRNAAEVRLQDYLDALTFYVDAGKGVFDHILFYENSGSNLSRIEALRLAAEANDMTLDAVTYVSDINPRRGKGVGELDLIDRALDHLRATHGEDCQVWKITGRLIVKNIAKMVRTAPASFDLYCDMRSVPLIGERLGGNDWVDTRLIAFSPRWQERCLKGLHERSGIVMEKHLFNAVKEAEAEDLDIKPRFRAQPRFKGICGGSLKDYESFEYRAKDGLRASMRVIAPGLWI